MEDLDVSEEHGLDEFDDGTSIMVMTDGSLRLRFGLMPPSWYEEEEAFEGFKDKLAAALGVDVLGLDKEFFGIPLPKPDTVATLRACARPPPSGISSSSSASPRRAATAAGGRPMGRHRSSRAAARAPRGFRRPRCRRHGPRRPCRRGQHWREPHGRQSGRHRSVRRARARRGDGHDLRRRWRRPREPARRDQPRPCAPLRCLGLRWRPLCSAASGVGVLAGAVGERGLCARTTTSDAPAAP